MPHLFQNKPIHSGAGETGTMAAESGGPVEHTCTGRQEVWGGLTVPTGQGETLTGPLD